MKKIIIIFILLISGCTKYYLGNISLEDNFPEYRLSYFTYRVLKGRIIAEARINNVNYRGHAYPIIEKPLLQG